MENNITEVPSNIKKRAYCSVCSAYRGKVVDGKVVTLHRFPVDHTISTTWECNVKSVIPDFKLTSYSKICSTHFYNGQFSKDSPPSLFNVSCLMRRRDIYNQNSIMTICAVFTCKNRTDMRSAWRKPKAKKADDAELLSDRPPNSVALAAANNGNRVSFHKFPRNKKMRQKWIDKIGRKHYFPTKHSSVCSKHFTDDQYVKTQDFYKRIGYKYKVCLHLKPDAIPTVFSEHGSETQLDTRRLTQFTGPRPKNNLEAAVTVTMSNERLVNFMGRIMQKYDSMRGRYAEEPYWDAVVLGTADEEQKLVYILQVQQKMARKELPLGLPIHVVADTPGPKIGNGGAAIVAMSFLKETYGDKLYSMRVLLIFAGGQSQRMPSASILGKIFSPVPLGNPIYQMLDVKLAIFMPLIPKMCPGVFVTCADDFLIYNLESKFQNEHFEFASTGFTALAHPSTLSVGTGHGVYVIEDMDKVDSHVPVQQCKCVEVLQKVNEVTMYEKGAVLKSENLSFSDGIQVSGRAVYTDSSFFFSHDITDIFLNFHQSHGPVSCEIDAYGDFLQALGTRATSKYIVNTANVSTVKPNLLETRKAIFDVLNGKPLTLLLMNSSKFIHIGTTKEYIQHFCCDDSFQQAMGLSKDVFNLWFSSTASTSSKHESGDSVSTKFHDCSRFSDISQGCVMHSVLPKESVISHTAVVEYCRFTVPVHIGQNVIISNCEYDSTVKAETSGNFTANLDIIKVPNDIFLHTCTIQPASSDDDTADKYVTVFFDIKDNLKKEARSNDFGALPFLGRTIEDYTVVLDIDPQTVEEGTQEIGSKVNLWFAQLFPVSGSMTESLALTLQCIDAVKKDSPGVVSLKDKQLVSMATALRERKVISMLYQRSKIYKEIMANSQ